MNLAPFDVHNRALLAQACPTDWVNPTPASRYNLVVLGGGTAGLVAAVGAAGLGAKVALVESALLGGDCLNFGCVPSKTLIRAARAAAAVREAARFGISVTDEPAIDFGAVMERVRAVRAGISPHDGAARLQSLGIDVFLGRGRFVSRDSLEVAGARLHFAKAVVATGARARIPNIPGLSAGQFFTNETIFNLTERPHQLLILGGGPIGCELAQAFARLGTQVTLQHRQPNLLAKEDPAAAAIIQAALARDGVKLILGQELQAPPPGQATALGKSGSESTPTLLVATGRQPNVENLGLEAAGVHAEALRGVVVDDFLRTSNPRIYASGDVCSRHQFTHAADAMSRLVIQNALFWGRKRVSALTIPRVTYTDPELACVGLTAPEATRAGLQVTTFIRELKDVDRSRTDGQTEGFVKILVAAGTDRIVGATLVAPHAGEMLSEVSVAMAAGLGLGKLAKVIHPYPTVAEAIRQCGDQYQRTQLTPFVKRLFERVLAWQR